MQLINDQKNLYKGQPRDDKGRYASWGLAGDGITESARVLEQQLDGGTTAEIVTAAQKLAAAVNRVPTITPAEARQIMSVINSFGAKPIPTDIWLDIEQACRNASSTAKDQRATIDKKRLTARAQRDKAKINKQ